jgi:LCP family protein required for cell wall assembly
MSDMPSRRDPAGPGDSLIPGVAGSRPPEPASRPKRRGMRIVLVSLTSFVVLIGAVVGGGYAYLNHLAGSIPRVPVHFTRLEAASKPLGGAPSGGMTVLITGAGIGPTGSSNPTGASGLIMLLHIDADEQAGGVVSIPPQAMVSVPGHGRTEIENALNYGGPSLLVQTVEDLTHLQIDHYARIDFAHVANMVDAIGGANVILPETTTSFGHTFHVGRNHLNGLTALYYARQPSLTEEGRVLRQQSLIRAVLRKLANHHLLTNPLTMYRVLHALIGMLTVDSNFTNGELSSLASELSGLNGRDGTFVTAPVHMVGGTVRLDRAISHQLWLAIGQDAIAGFAQQYPFTVTPVAPR